MIAVTTFKTLPRTFSVYPNSNRQHTSAVTKYQESNCVFGLNVATVYTELLAFINDRCDWFQILSFIECSNAGQFNTITRRTRRSLDQSYPEDSPSFGYASILSLEAAAHYNNSIVREDDAAPPLVHQSHVDSSEQQDERIEGLESIMAKMQRTIRVAHFSN